MSLRTTLERERSRYALAPGAFDRLVEARRRQARRQRLFTTTAALVLGAFAVAAVVAAFRSTGRPTPANEPGPRITPQNVGSLHAVWRAALPHRASVLVIADGVVVALSDMEDLPRGVPPQVAAYPIDCRPHACDPLWQAPIGSIGLQPAGPVVHDGVVYVAGDGVYAFELRCRTDGGECAPLWHARVSGGATQPVADDTSLYVGSSSGRVYAFPLACSPTATACRPRWVSSPVGMPLLVSDVVDGRVLVSVAAVEYMPHLDRLFAYDADCSTPCRPAEVADVPGQRFASMPVVENGVMYLGTAVDGGEGSIRAYDAACGLAPSCRLWSLEEHEGLNIPRPVVGDGVVVTAARFSTQRIRAYPTGSERPDALWTACCIQDISDSLPVIADGLVYVPSLTGGVTAYPVHCTTRPLCSPAWSWAGERPVGSSGATAVAVGGGTLVAAARDDELVAFSPAPPPPALSPADRTSAALFYAAVGIVGVAFLLVRRRRLGAPR